MRLQDPQYLKLGVTDQVAGDTFLANVRNTMTQESIRVSNPRATLLRLQCTYLSA
jgi:hypothetical protein